MGFDRWVFDVVGLVLMGGCQWVGVDGGCWWTDIGVGCWC